MRIRIEHDDDQLNVIDKVNKAIEEYGLEFVDVDEEHDGYVFYDLVKKEK